MFKNCEAQSNINQMILVGVCNGFSAISQQLALIFQREVENCDGCVVGLIWKFMLIRI